MGSRSYDLPERLIWFASDVSRIAEALPVTPLGRHVMRQLIRACTSPMANHGEAQAAESQADFVHKLKICLKELRETDRWLRLIEVRELAGCGESLRKALVETDELIRIFVVSVRTADRHLEGRAS